VSIQNEEIAEMLRSEVEAWTSGDIESIVAGNASVKAGFGWRAEAWRGQNPSTEVLTERLTKFFENMEYYYIEPTEIHTWSEGNIGLAWGIITESFKQKGQPPEKVQARVTFTFKKETTGWQQIMYHRDIQPFNEDGRYPVELTQV